MGNVSTSFSSDDAIAVASITAKTLHDSAKQLSRGPEEVAPKYNLVDRNEQALRNFSLDEGHVLLHVYDLRFKVLGQMASLAGAFHTGIEIHGYEYSFGTPTGVYRNEPLSESRHVYRSSIVMGRVKLSEDDVVRQIQDLGKVWPGDEYNCFGKNCNGFCAALVKLLGLGMLPPWLDRLSRMSNEVTALAKALLETPAATLPDLAGGVSAAKTDELRDALGAAATKLRTVRLADLPLGPLRDHDELMEVEL